MTVALASLAFRHSDNGDQRTRKLIDLHTHLVAAAAAAAAPNVSSATGTLAVANGGTGATTAAAAATALGVGAADSPTFTGLTLSGGQITLGTSNLIGEAANVVAQRNGTSAQFFRIYNTYTDAANYERATIHWTGNILRIGTDTSAGTGASRGLAFVTNGNLRWEINNHLYPAQDLTLDFGTVSRRPRRIYVGTELVAFGNTITAATGTGNMVLSASPTFTGTITAAAATLSSDLQVATTVRLNTATNPTLKVTPTIGVSPSIATSADSAIATALGNSAIFAGAGVFAYGRQPEIAIGKSNHATIGSHTLASGTIGSLTFYGSNGTDFVRGASMRALAAAPGATDYLSSSLIFEIAKADGSALVQRLQLNDAGAIIYQGSSVALATFTSSGVDVAGLVQCDSLRIDASPTAAAVAQTHHVPISINGVTYKLLLAS